mmetsp:Transcript_158378/g.279507  ORF Transcript_158378/g.279507 Transcript_158378/m.279507 type:complete len:188 (+) Transcript_158378:3-566(+)
MVDVLVKHAVNSEEQLLIQVPATATLKDVKLACAELVGAKLPNGRIVKKVGQGFQSFKDADALGDRRSLFFLGDDLKMNIKKGPKGEIQLSVAQAKALQRELHKGFSVDAFQSSLRRAERVYATDARKLSLEKQRLAFEVQKPIIVKYGFPGDGSGVMAMIGVLNTFTTPDFQEMGDKINALFNPPK